MTHLYFHWYFIFFLYLNWHPLASSNPLICVRIYIIFVFVFTFVIDQSSDLKMEGCTMDSVIIKQHLSVAVTETSSKMQKIRQNCKRKMFRNILLQTSPRQFSTSLADISSQSNPNEKLHNHLMKVEFHPPVS